MTLIITRYIVSYGTVANTRSGNPVYRVNFTDGDSMLTEPDAVIPVGNWLPHRGWGIEEVPATLTVRKGRIVHISGKDTMDLYTEKLRDERERGNARLHKVMHDLNERRGQ